MNDAWRVSFAFASVSPSTDDTPVSASQDFSQPPDSASHIPENYLYLHNQTTTSGSRGIACLAMGVMDRAGHLMLRSNPYRRPQLWAHAEAPLPEHFQVPPRPVTRQIHPYKRAAVCCGSCVLMSVTIPPCSQDLTSVRRYWPDAPDPAPGAGPATPDAELHSAARVEFRIWQQGRVNLEALVAKLESAVRHAVWDLLTEFTILTAPIEEASTPAPTPTLTPSATPSTTPNGPHSMALAMPALGKDREREYAWGGFRHSGICWQASK